MKKRIQILEFNKPGHNLSHAMSLVYELREKYEVDLKFIQYDQRLSSIISSSRIENYDMVIFSTLDHFFVRWLFRGPILRLNKKTVIVGVLHETRPLKKKYRQFLWRLLVLTGQIDKVVVYTNDWCSNVGEADGVFAKCTLAVGEIEPLSFTGKKQILYLGVVTYEKGADFLATICEMLPAGYSIKIVGKCPVEDFKSKIESLFLPHIETGRIIWVYDNFTEAEKLDLIKSSVALIAPYRLDHGRASGIAIDSIRHQVPILYEVAHPWMADFFHSNNYPKAIAMDITKLTSGTLGLMCSAAYDLRYEIGEVNAVACNGLLPLVDGLFRQCMPSSNSIS